MNRLYFNKCKLCTWLNGGKRRHNRKGYLSKCRRWSLNIILFPFRWKWPYQPTKQITYLFLFIIIHVRSRESFLRLCSKWKKLASEELTFLQAISLVLFFIQNCSKSTIWREEDKNKCWLNSSVKGRMKYRDWLIDPNFRVRLVSALFWRSLLAANWWENQPVTWLDASKALSSMNENHNNDSHGQVLFNTNRELFCYCGFHRECKQITSSSLA